MLKRKNKGFTILELLVVVAIIAIIVAIAIPSFIGKIDKAKDTADLAEIDSVQKALAVYYMDNGNYPTLQGADATLSQPQPVEGSPQNIDFSKIVPNYLATLPHFSYWWVDYKGVVYHTQKPIGNVTGGVFTPTSGYTYTLYKADGSTQVLSGVYTLQAGDYILGKDDKGRDLPKLSVIFKNEKMHPESPEYAGASSLSSGDPSKMLTADQWAAFDWSNVKAPAGQVSANIGVDAWGNPVNMDLWSVSKITDANYGPVGTICLNYDQYASGAGYKGAYSNGQIVGYVPAKVKLSGDTTFADVSDMNFTFWGCTSLTVAPAIPNTVITMTNTFQDCTSLTAAPVIPSSVTNLDAAFFGCSSLTTAPEIPSSVTRMNFTFFNCVNLASAPVIPSSVTETNYTFQGCTKLGY